MKVLVIDPKIQKEILNVSWSGKFIKTIFTRKLSVSTCVCAFGGGFSLMFLSDAKIAA